MGKYFKFPHEWVEAIQELQIDVRADVYAAIMEYGITRSGTPSKKRMVKLIMGLVRPMIDAGLCDGYDDAQCGVCTHGEVSACEVQTATGVCVRAAETDGCNGEISPLYIYNNNLSVIDYEDNSAKEKENIKEKEKRTRFKPPTKEECIAFASEIGYDKAMYFFDFYTGNGWKIGRNTMKDWRATMRNWKRRDEDGSQCHNDQRKRASAAVASSAEAQFARLVSGVGEKECYDI